MTPRIAVLCLALATLLSGCSYELQHHLGEDDANEIYTLLSRNGISAKKAPEEGGNEVTYLIAVNKADAPQATELLRAHSLPRPQQVGLEQFAKGKGMIPTETEQKAMFLQSIAGEVSRLLNKIDGVLESQTIVNIPENNDLSQADKKPTNSASVLIKYRATMEGKPPVEEAAVRQLVAKALPEMKPENVTVIMVPALAASAEVTDASRLQSVLGMQMTAASVQQFKVMVGGLAAVMVIMAGITSFMFLRGSAPGTPPPSRARR